jgi:long-chain acyl-CoA synthetase
MLDLQQYQSLGEALRAAVETWPNETCLIESDRNRERTRLTYSDFEQMALPLARALQDAGFQPGDRTAIIMTNQSKWLITAYAVFYCGGVLVPLDYKLTGSEHVGLLASSEAKILVTEYHLWQAISQVREFAALPLTTVLVTEAPAGAELGKAFRWEEFQRKGNPEFIARKREDTACIVYSSGTGGRPKGCVLTHDNYLEQCWALTRWYPFWVGVNYLSILPTSHAADFMVGFIGPLVCGATVVHLRTVRPEFVRDAFTRYKITYVTLVPMVLKNLEKGLRSKIAELSSSKRWMLDRLIGVNKLLTKGRPRLAISRLLLPQIHSAFGGDLRALIVGGAFADPSTLQFFYDLGIPVVNAYGQTEGVTAFTAGDLKPFRADSVGKPLPGVELRILSPDAEGVGQVAARSRTVMSHYLNDPELTAETIVDGWLLTGDLGRLDESGYLHLYGRAKNMIVTEGGKNIYPEDIENVFDSLPVKEFCVFATNYVWAKKELGGESLVLVLRLDTNQKFTAALRDDIAARNRQLPDFKRVGGYVLAPKDFPRNTALKIKRKELAEELANTVERSAMVML